MYSEDDLLPISALQHLTFCRRQCALIHIEQLWVDNIFTAQGNVLHERVHDEKRESRRDVRLEHGMPLRSLRLGLVGKGDVVEFHRDVSGKSWRPFPVEYKRGRNKEEECDRVQLCAQALCLEEMLGVGAASGAIYYGKDRRRVEVFLRFCGEQQKTRLVNCMSLSARGRRRDRCTKRNATPVRCTNYACLKSWKRIVPSGSF